MDSREILETARTFYNEIMEQYAASDFYTRLPLNKFWQGEAMAIMRDIIATADLPTAVVQRAQETFMFSVNVQTPIEERAVDWLLAEQLSRDVDLLTMRPEIEELEFSFPGNNVVRGGRSLTPDFIRTVNIALSIAQFFSRPQALHNSKPTEKLAIVELGGGLGHLARTLRLLGLSRSHVMIDLPETLVFSYCYLSLNFPTARLLLVGSEQSAVQLAAGEYDYAFVPALLADNAMPEYDLFVNTASLGEMRNEVIRHWIDLVQDRLDVRYLYTLNRYLNTIDPVQHAWRWEENECSLHYDRRWKLLHWELEPRFTRCPYLDTRRARLVEIAAERLAIVDAGECARTSQTLLDDVRAEDWHDMRHNKIMTRGDWILGHDLTRSGTLFKLWDAIRLNPSIEAVATLLRYLDTLIVGDDREFEERQYYEQLFLSLYDPEKNRDLAALADRIKSHRSSMERKQPTLLIQGRRAFNFVSAGDRIVAVAFTLGPVELFKDRLGERDLPPVLFTGSSLAEVAAKAAHIDLSIQVLATDAAVDVIAEGGQVYAMQRPQAGHLGRYNNQVISGELIDEVRSKIERVGLAASGTPFVPPSHTI